MQRGEAAAEVPDSPAAPDEEAATPAPDSAVPEPVSDGSASEDDGPDLVEDDAGDRADAQPDPTAEVPDLEPETAPVPDAGPDLAPAPEAEPEIAALPDAEPETAALPDAEPETAALPDAEPETAAVPDVEPDPVPEVPDVEPDPVPDVPDAEPDPVPDVPDAEPEPEPCEPGPCPLQAGVCAGASGVCGGGGEVACGLADYVAVSPWYEVEEVSCDGLDNDCDGETDEPEPCLACPVLPAPLKLGDKGRFTPGVHYTASLDGDAWVAAAVEIGDTDDRALEVHRLSDGVPIASVAVPPEALTFTGNATLAASGGALWAAAKGKNGVRAVRLAKDGEVLATIDLPSVLLPNEWPIVTGLPSGDPAGVLLRGTGGELRFVQLSGGGPGDGVDLAGAHLEKASVALDPDGGFHALVSLSPPAPGVGSWAEAEDPELLELGTDWKPKRVRIAADGTVHALYRDGSTAWYRRRTPSGWAPGEYVAGTDSLDLALDPSGAPVVVYRSGSLHTIWMARRAAPAVWYHVPIHPTGAALLDPTVEIDPWNRLQVFYRHETVPGAPVLKSFFACPDATAQKGLCDGPCSGADPCDPDGCGGTCGPCSDTCVGPSATVLPVSSWDASHAPGEACDVGAILASDGETAGLDHLTANGYGEIDAVPVSGCAGADLGGVHADGIVVLRAARTSLACLAACGTSPTTGENLCGTDPYTVVFAGATPDALQHLATVLVEGKDLADYAVPLEAPARYVVVCRGNGSHKRDDLVLDSVRLEPPACMP